MKFRRILEVLCLQVLQKRFWVQFHDLCEQKWSGTHFGSFRLSSFIKKIMGAIPRFVRPKMKLFTVMFRYILEVLCLQDLQKKVWAQFHGLCVQERSCLLWNSDVFSKFSAYKVYRKSSGRNSTICASKNEAVCCEIQTHFGSYLPASFTEKDVGAIPRFVRPKSKRCAVKFRRISKVLCLQGSQKKFWRYSTIYVSKNPAVCCDVQTHLWSFRLSSFTKKVLGAFSRSMRPKTKLFAVELRRIPEVLCLQVLQKKFWAYFPRFARPKTNLFAVKLRRILEVLCQDLQKRLCVQFNDFCARKRSCLLWSSDAFWNFSASKIYRKSCGHNSTICASKNEAVSREIQTHSGSSKSASFKEKVVGAIPRLFRPRTKLFAVKFRYILKFSACGFYEKVVDAIPRFLCQKPSCLLWNSGAFWSSRFARF